MNKFKEFLASVFIGIRVWAEYGHLSKKKQRKAKKKLMKKMV